jgi:hypothetical protein
MFRFGEQATNTDPSKESGARGGVGNSNKHQRGNKKETMMGCQGSEIGGKVNEALTTVIVQLLEIIYLERNLNQSHGSKSWSLGMGEIRMSMEHELQLVSEMKTESTYYSSGSTFWGQMRGYKDMTMYVAWLANQGIRNILGPLLISCFSSLLQKRTSSMEAGSQLRAKRIQQLRNRASHNTMHGP